MTIQRRNTRQRQLVLDAVRSRDDHPTAEDIYLDVCGKDAHVSRGTVYRNLNLLEETGAIKSLHIPGGNRFDWRTDGHPHVVCTECGAVADVMTLPYDADLDGAAETETGFDVDAHSTVFFGLCPKCRGK